MGSSKAVVTALLLHLVLALAVNGETREKRSILIPAGFRPPPYYPPPFFPDRGFIVPRPIRPMFNMSARETYDPETETCCHGNVFPFDKNSAPACCGDKAYDMDNQFCCNGVTNDRLQGVKCCGKTTYNPSNSLCCNGKVVSITAEEKGNAECCGEQKYDTKKNLCCGGLGLEAKILDRKSEDEFCCGMEACDSKTQACCSDLTLKGANVVNTAYHVVPREADTNKTICCWGGKLFDPSSQTCCGTELVEGSSQLCCGSKTINPENQLCCVGDDGEQTPMNGKGPKERCCGPKVGNMETQLCCRNNLLEKSSPSQSCCGDQAIDGKNEFCLLKVDNNGSVFEVIKKTNPEQNAMCGEQPFDMRAEKCCPTFDGIKVTPKQSNSSYLCCGAQTYAWDEGICCVDRVAKQFKLHEGKKNMLIDCCGLDTYDTSKEICCGGKSQPRSETAMCCGGSDVYDLKSDMCCMTPDQGELKFAVMARRGNTTNCCGLKSYDYTKEICCKGQTFPNDGKSLCCGDQSYNTEKQLCCGGNILPMKDRKSAACCYYGMGNQPLDIDITIIKQTYYGFDRKR